MPKYTADAENVTAEGHEASSDQGQELSKKELGRMKSKQAVLAATVKKQRPEVQDDDDIEEHESVKRARWRS